MKRVPAIALAVAACAAFTTANAQFSARSQTVKVPGVSTPASAGGFNMGADNCATPHTNAGTGNVTGVPFTTGTTGTTGQAEANCYAFGTTGVSNDVWFGWTSNSSGNGKITTCAGTSLDTKIAVWPNNEPSSCPADGTSIACVDDACGLQTSVTWAVTSGTTYTFQVGTFPGAAGGSGTFDVQQTAPPPCGQFDDGTTENALGLTAGGEMGWLQAFGCTPAITQVNNVQTAYGTLMFPGSVTNGNTSRVALHDDTDADPSNGTTFLTSVNTVVVNGDTDILNTVAISTTRTGTSIITWGLVTADQIGGEFPGPMDQDNPTPNSWVVGSTLGPGSMDIQNLSNNNVAPLQMQAIGFPAAWLLRIDADQGGGGTGTSDCFGDGSGTVACPCGNDGGAGTGGGCANGAPMPAGQGAVLSASGSNSVGADDLVLTADFTTNQPGLFFQGNNSINGGNGSAFGDGLRCCGQNVIRLEIADPAGANGSHTTSTTAAILGTSPGGTTNAGDTRCYQWWYRNPNRSLCGSNFNLSNSILVTWGA